MKKYQRKRPVGGVDYPRTLQECTEWFATENACIDYIDQLRWGQGFVCPSCGGRKGWRMATGLIRCAACKRKTSVIAGTMFEGTRKPLRLWFQAMWYITSQKFGGSALGLQHVLGLGSYRTAWTWLHKMRAAMVRPGRDRLSGTVEIDETFVGGVDTGGKRGRGAARKSVVVIAVEILEPKGFGRVRMKSIPDASGESLIPFVSESVEPGSIVHTDSWGGYNGLSKKGYMHKRTNLSDSGDPAHVVMPGVHRIASLLKRWILGTHQGAVSGKHLAYYLDEYSFRFNRRTSRARGLLFYRLMQQAVEISPPSYRQLVQKHEPSL